MFVYPSPDQESLSISLVQSGSTMFLGGLIVGLLVYASKYPRITLYAHIEGTSYGLSMVVIGLLIGSTKYVGKLNEWECYLVWTSQIVGWPMWLSQLCQCFWGTNQMNKIVAEQAKAPGGKSWQELFVQVCHFAAAFGIVGWAVLVKSLLNPRV